MTLRSLCAALAAALALPACDPSNGADESDPEACGGDTSSGGEPALTHGSFSLRLERSDSQTSDPFAGTGTVIATFEYEQCLRQFYETHPQWSDDGPQGVAIFGGREAGGEGWRDRLCEQSDAQCEIASIGQDVDMLSVTYRVSGPLEGHTLEFGPVPTEALAACSDGVAPTMRFVGVRGYDAETGELLWTPEAISPPRASVGGVVEVLAAR